MVGRPLKHTFRRHQRWTHLRNVSDGTAPAHLSPSPLVSACSPPERAPCATATVSADATRAPPSSTHLLRVYVFPLDIRLAWPLLPARVLLERDAHLRPPLCHGRHERGRRRLCRRRGHEPTRLCVCSGEPCHHLCCARACREWLPRRRRDRVCLHGRVLGSCGLLARPHVDVCGLPLVFSDLVPCCGG